MNLGMAFTTFFETPAGQAVVLLFLLAVLDFAAGTFAAIRDNVFQMDSVAAWLRKHLAGRVLPITGALVIGHLAGGLTIDDGVTGLLDAGTIITGIGLTGAVAYILETIASLRESLIPKPGTREIPED